MKNSVGSNQLAEAGFGSNNTGLGTRHPPRGAICSLLVPVLITGGARGTACGRPRGITPRQP
jgi:hypothetical protein